MLEKKRGQDIQLKFYGPTIDKLGGAPADAVISSLWALQRLVYIIGMKSEGRAFGQRMKPSAKVRRDYAVVCRPAEVGSHIQPLQIANRAGAFTPAAVVAREQLLHALKAFDSGEANVVERAIPNARERWFMADAAAGLLPEADSGIDVTVRAGSFGPFSFKADRARQTIERFRSGKPPQPEKETVVGKLKAVDYALTVVTIQPVGARGVRIGYPLQIESFLQANVRRRVSLFGDPQVNAAGNVVGFENLINLTEIEPSLPAIEYFDSGGRKVAARRPLPILVAYDFEDRCFVSQDDDLGIDAYSDSYSDIRSNILEELDVLWRNYALAPDDELASDALLAKRALLHRFYMAPE
jgi:hypothetical protein